MTVDLSDIEQYENGWEWSKSKSKYHFDWSKHDAPGDPWFVPLGRFEGDWTTELEIIRNRSKQDTWAEMDKSRAESTNAPSYIKLEEHDVTRGGAKAETPIIARTEDFSSCPQIQKMADWFGVENAQKNIHTQYTGQQFTLHIDKQWSRCPEDPDRVVRIITMLEDWKPGQFYSYGTYIYSHWRAGDINAYSWQDTPHATANASLWPRSILRVTGLKTDITNKFLAEATADKTYRL